MDSNSVWAESFPEPLSEPRQRVWLPRWLEQPRGVSLQSKAPQQEAASLQALAVMLVLAAQAK